MTKNGVLPSFWDRLQQCGASQLPEKTISVEAFESAVLRDIERLLNERRPNLRGLPDSLRATIIAYGLADLTAFDVSSSSGASNLALAIQEAIRDFEPRLYNIAVGVIPGDATFRIRADLRVEPAVDRLQFQAVVKHDTSTLKLSQLDRLTKL